MLFRVGEEVARATSIVRYAPGSKFPRHVHTGGEEILVLEGTFQDEHADYPAGTYFRNPPGTSHIPGSADGCTIFVRLWQFRTGDNAHVVRRPEASRPTGDARHLFDDGFEAVYLRCWSAGVQVDIENLRGLEVLVVSGDLVTDDDELEPQTWCRLPANVPLRAKAGGAGVTLWIKDAPLEHADVLTLPHNRVEQGRKSNAG